MTNSRGRRTQRRAAARRRRTVMAIPDRIRALAAPQTRPENRKPGTVTSTNGALTPRQEDRVTDFSDTHAAIAAYAENIRIAQLQMRGLILGVCPGPHRYVQHRDGTAWCEACRYTTDGERIPGSGEAS